MKTSTKTLLALLLLTGIQLPAQSIPEYINYQGLLKAADGSPLATGNYAIEFNIYDQANGGTKVWGPFLFDGNLGNGHGPLVPVVNGSFNVIIGPKDTSGASITNAFAGPSRFVELKVNGGAPILPRQQFLSTVYAFEAIHAQYSQSAGQAAILAREAADVLSPPGSIIAFGGTNIPSGWLLCDGRSLARTNYPSLFSAISSSWGSADAYSFNLPDLRGFFLRGRDGGVGRDPDRTARAALTSGGAGGDAVGSQQADAFKAHKHGVPTDYHPGADYPSLTFSGGNDQNFSDLPGTSSAGGNETRPLNAYVNYIIKY